MSTHGGNSLQAQLELNDVPEFANEPGPGHYFGPDSVGFSALGQQNLAKHHSAPNISMARTGWDSWEKVRVSKVHSRAYVGRDSPGPAYNVEGLLNKKTTKIGTSQRPPLSQVDPHGSPGPVYNLRDAPGHSIGTKGFPTAQRFSSVKDGGIGPGQYPRKDTALQLGNGRSIGTGRAAWEKVLTPGIESEGRCRASPGPGPPLWRTAKDASSGAGPFGRSERFQAPKSGPAGPGPGQYRRTERDVSNRKQYVSDTPNVSAVSFGKKPTKPRFRCLAAMRCANHGGWGYF